MSRFKDNLFNANHRQAMIRTYGFTEAQWVTVEELMEDLERDIKDVIE